MILQPFLIDKFDALSTLQKLSGFPQISLKKFFKQLVKPQLKSPRGEGSKKNLQDNINVPMIQERKEAFTNFLDTLYYYLKFRKTDAQALELMLLAFQAGRLIGKSI